MVHIAVDIPTFYRLDELGVEVRVPVTVRYDLHVVQTGSGANPASCPMGYGGRVPLG
jgi:hypothetical protein